MGAGDRRADAGAADHVDLDAGLGERAQLTQRELAIAVGYTEGHASRLETNQRPPDLATVASRIGRDNIAESTALR